MDDAELLTLPKAELHIHIEGTLEPEMVFALAARNNVALPYASVDQLRSAHAFADLPHFLDLYYACMAVLRTEDDFADLAAAYLRKAATQGVTHAEIFFDPQAHTSRGVDLGVVVRGLRRGLDAASSETGVHADLIACFLRDKPVADAMTTLDALEPFFDSIIGIGLDSAELGFPPGQFAPVFDRARDAGLHVVAHAGEEGPAQYIWEALDVLGIERVDHGVRALEDRALLTRLAADRIPLTTCPLSNVRLRGVEKLSDHPLLDLLDAGLVVTINSDDPAYFGGYVGDAFVEVRRELDLSDGHLRAIAQNSFDASFTARSSHEH
ncbi:adenosine deaminase [Gordonia otitidis]|uniref:Adenine deaminase n=1 Tax=Gordonia otitidis (strain DSM 44809 / CCUG 52243 / JCM 12355 / NBRC 100426 / IFM 10032) TaxID=1108044 RepID=H5TN15_GORO1|nr:adenosine deaminase [Gordonia otitidis]GAB34873.1 adenosine deaminase [Gordonia otitidis NBRC 100426]